jgi:hypothetical protein
VVPSSGKPEKSYYVRDEKKRKSSKKFKKLWKDPIKTTKKLQGKSRKTSNEKAKESDHLGTKCKRKVKSAQSLRKTLEEKPSKKNL